MLSSRFIAWHMPANHTVAMSVSVNGSAPAGSRAGEREDEERADGERRHQLGERRQLQPVVEDADARTWRAPPAAPAPTARRSPPRPAASGRSTKATIVAPAIATPPIVGVGWLCQRSGRGGTTAPIDADSRRITRTQQDRRDERRQEAATSGSNWQAGVHQLATRSVQRRVPVGHDERPRAEHALADRVEAGRRPGQQLLQALQLQPVDRVAGLGFDERQRESSG